jgi:hypothetical protein
VARSLAQHVSQSEALAEAVSTAQRTLQGLLDGKLRQSSEKVGTLTVVTALAAANPQGEDAQVTAAQTTDFLASYYKEEINEEVLSCTRSGCSLFTLNCCKIQLP